jgi:putative transposase
VTYYTVFVIDPASRRVQVVGSTAHPDERFMRQAGRTLTAADEGVLGGQRVLICDRDAKWSAPVRARVGEAGIRVVQTPYQAPNAALSSCSRHPAGRASNRLVTTTNGRFGRDRPHAATANVVVCETTSHSRQRRRIRVR